MKREQNKRRWKNKEMKEYKGSFKKWQSWKAFYMTTQFEDLNFRVPIIQESWLIKAKGTHLLITNMKLNQLREITQLGKLRVTNQLLKVGREAIYYLQFMIIHLQMKCNFIVKKVALVISIRATWVMTKIWPEKSMKFIRVQFPIWWILRGIIRGQYLQRKAILLLNRD